MVSGSGVRLASSTPLGDDAWRSSEVPAQANRVAGWVMLVFTLGTALSAGLQRHLDPNQGTQRLIELDLGEAFACAAVVSLLMANTLGKRGLDRFDFGIIVLSALSWFLPEFHAVYLGMTLAGAWLYRRHLDGSSAREIGQIWLALSLCELWGKVAFKVFYRLIEPFEVSLMAWIGRWAFPNLRASGVYLSTQTNWSVVMLEGCSSFHNLSLAVLLWLCVLKIAGQRANKGAFQALAVSAALVVAINIARVLAMLPSRDAYLFWHDGTGSVIVALASVAASVLPIMIRVERSAC